MDIHIILVRRFAITKEEMNLTIATMSTVHKEKQKEMNERQQKKVKKVCNIGIWMDARMDEHVQCSVMTCARGKYLYIMYMSIMYHVSCVMYHVSYVMYHDIMYHIRCRSKNVLPKLNINMPNHLSIQPLPNPPHLHNMLMR